MALDNLVLDIIADKLNDEVVGSFLDHPYSLAHSQFALPYHSGSNVKNKGRGTIVFSLEVNNSFITYNFDRYTKVQENSAFSNIIKRIAGTRIKSVTKTLGERVLTLELEVFKKEIDIIESGFFLIFEFFPQKPNCYLVSRDTNKILAQYKEQGDIMSERYMARNLPYLPLPPRRTLGDGMMNLAEAKPYLSRSTYNYLEEYLKNHCFQEAVEQLLKSKDLYILPRGLEPFHFDHPEAKKLEFEDIYTFYHEDQKKLASSLKEVKLKNLVDHQLRLALKKLVNLERDLNNNRGKLIYRDYGELLYLYQTDYSGNESTVKIDGYEIPIDKDLDYVDNANLYFKRYKKSKNAIPILESLIIKTRDEISYLNKKVLDIKNGTPRDIQELKTELIDTGYIKDKTLIKQFKKSVKKRYEPHYLNLDNIKIGYGLNDLQNESLTFDIASIHSLFFHVKDLPGPHVVLFSECLNPNAQELAAELALYLAHKDEGEVYFTEIKNVKKNKEKRGLVNILRFKTIIIKSIRPSSIKNFKEMK